MISKWERLCLSDYKMAVKMTPQGACGNKWELEQNTKQSQPRGSDQHVLTPVFQYSGLAGAGLCSVPSFPTNLPCALEQMTSALWASVLCVAQWCFGCVLAPCRFCLISQDPCWKERGQEPGLPDLGTDVSICFLILHFCIVSHSNRGFWAHRKFVNC